MKRREFGRLDGRVAVVTGASSGIGRTVAVELARAGARLFVTSRTSEEGLRETIALSGQPTSAVETFLGDLSQPEVCDRLVDVVWAQCGPAAVWVNNAGVDLLTGDGAALNYGQKLERLWSVDVCSTVRLCRNVGQRMKAEGSGTIVNVGWDQADRGMAGDSGELFATAKNAIMGFTRSLSVSLAPEVRVNCVAPGWIKTAWGEGASDYWQDRVIKETPLARWGTPQDIANTIRFLCSDEASFVTGQIINVNGGAVR